MNNKPEAIKLETPYEVKLCMLPISIMQMCIGVYFIYTKDILIGKGITAVLGGIFIIFCGIYNGVSWFNKKNKVSLLAKIMFFALLISLISFTTAIAIEVIYK